ncbi:MAG: ABC transporter permease [Planctomycetes bacterium]|nr:ABC transporter permease [Planctomycetota bacterium]
MARDDRPFLWALAIIGGAYVVLILAMVESNAHYVSQKGLVGFGTPEIRFAIWFSLLTSSLSALLSTIVALPLGYLMSRTQFRGKRLLDAILDIPIVLPPLVVGLSLLIMFQTLPGRLFQENLFPVTYQRVSVVLAQFAVAAAFAVRAMKITFDQMTPRSEQVAMTLGCSRAQAFFRVVLPEARRGILAAFAIAWARSFGEFGPVLVFSGATRMKTEVLSTTVFLELSVGRLEAAASVSLFMVVIAMAVLLVLRFLGPADAVGRTVRP